jgi:hypothetical protein
MPEKGTEKAITVDANVVHFNCLFLIRGNLPDNFGINRIEDFSNSILEKFPIAYSEYIRVEYEQTSGLEYITRWLTERHKNGLAIKVNCIPLRRQVESCLGRDYGFNCQSKDMRYLQTCKDTFFKKFITQNPTHFLRRHRNRRGRTMDQYLENEEGIKILTIDDCCALFLDCGN